MSNYRYADPRTWGPSFGVYDNANNAQNQGFMPQAPARGETSGQRGGGRGRGAKKNNKGSRPPPSQPGITQVDPEKKGELPKPQHLSKTSSELKNDPLYEEAFFPSPSDELREISKESNIFPSCDGLMAIMEELYLEMSARSFNYKRNVPIAAHNYYFSVLAYARLLHLLKLNKRSLTYDETQFVYQVIEQGKFDVPASFNKYLAGFGNTTLPSGVKQWFDMNKPDLRTSNAGLSGYFGRISHCPGGYASYPCLGVFAQRIFEDLRYTYEVAIDPEAVSEWDLASPFNYPDHPINSNCIGYSPAERLTNDQAQFYSTKNITDGEFGSVNDSLPLNILLMNGVQKFMNEIPGIKLLPVPDSEMGSQGQLVTTVVVNFARVPARHTYVAKSCLRIVGSIAYLGSSFMYKFKKNDYNIDEQRHLWPNVFVHGRQPPAAYIDHFILNSTGIDPKLDVYDYESTPFILPLRLKTITSRDVTAKN